MTEHPCKNGTYLRNYPLFQLTFFSLMRLMFRLQFCSLHCTLRWWRLQNCSRNVSLIKEKKKLSWNKGYFINIDNSQQLRTSFQEYIKNGTTLYYQLTPPTLSLSFFTLYGGWLADGHGAAAFCPPAADQERLGPRSEDGEWPASALLLLLRHVQYGTHKSY